MLNCEYLIHGQSGFSEAFVFVSDGVCKGFQPISSYGCKYFFITTSKCTINITVVSFYILYTHTCFNISVIFKGFYICALSSYCMVVILIVHLLLAIKTIKMYGTCITIMDVNSLCSTHKSECRGNYYKLICQRFYGLGK